MKKYNHAWTEVRAIAHGRYFEIGTIRSDERGVYRVFTVYGKDPWQGILEHTHKNGWVYNGECWPL